MIANDRIVRPGYWSCVRCSMTGDDTSEVHSKSHCDYIRKLDRIIKTVVSTVGEFYR